MTEVEGIRHDGWAEVVLNRPETKNAITGPLGEHLATTVNGFSADAEVSAILLRGAEGAFCSGLDLKAFNAEPAPDWLADFQAIWRGAHRALFDCPVPIVCAMERYAINGGAALAIAADLLVVGERSFVQVAEVQLGMAAPYNMAWMNLRLSESTRAQIALIGDRLNGGDLARLGIAHQVVADDEILQTATDICARMAEYPTGATRKIKSGLRAHVQSTADEWFDMAVGADQGPRVAPGRVK